MSRNCARFPLTLAVLLSFVTACSPFESPAIPTSVPLTAVSATSTPSEPTVTPQATVAPTSSTPALQASRPVEELDCPIGTLTPCETQTLHRAIPLTGTGYTLHYASDRTALDAWDARSYGLGGWMLEVQHAYDPAHHTLYLGDGERLTVEQPVALRSGELAIAAANDSEVYVFNSEGRHLRTLDALTGAVHYEFAYDNDGRLTGIKDRDNNQTTIERDSNGAPTAIIAPLGARTILNLDTNGYLAKAIDPVEESVALTYTTAGLLTAFTDSEGNVSHFDYDTLGRLDREELSDGSVRSRSYMGSAASYTITLKTAMLRTTTYAVERQAGGAIRRLLTDSSGARIEELIGADGSRKVTLSDGTRIEIQWEPDPRWGLQAPILKQFTQTTPSGLSTTITGDRVVALAKPDDPLSLQTLTERLTINGQTSVSEYDAVTRTLTATSAAGRTSVAMLDAQGRVLGEQAANFARASYSYDARGRLTAIGQGEGDNARGAALTYDDEQGALRITDALSRTQELRFDSSGRLLQVILPGERRIGFGYDGRGNLTALTPPGQPAHSLGYTPVDLPSTYQPPRLGDQDQPTQQEYNPDGQLATYTRPDGGHVGFDYDSTGRLSRIKLRRGELSANYDARTGYLAGLSAPGNLKLTYSYDGVLPTGETWSGPIAGQVSWAYDNRFRVASQSVGGDTVAFGYDEDDLLDKAGELALSRDKQSGLVTSATLGGIVSTWEYNTFGEPTSYRSTVGDQELYAIQYTYDKLGRISERKETIAGDTHAYSYTYDVAGRLAEVRRDGQLTHSYTYDANGNRLSATGPNGTANGAYDAQDRLRQYGDTDYTYTVNGELLSKTISGKTTGYQYDELGNLLTVTQPDGTKIEYLVDGQGRRVGKKVNDTLVQGFLYQDDLRPVAELDGSGNIVSRFVYASGRNVPDYMVKGSTTYRILTDHLGSPRLVVNAATGAMAQRMDYDAFGNITQDTNPGFQPFGFAGGFYDRDTQLERFGSRDYDAETGRWTVRDPIGFAGGDANLYGYVLNDPINQVDSEGLSWQQWAFRLELVFRLMVNGARIGSMYVSQHEDGQLHASPLNWKHTSGSGAPGTRPGDEVLQEADRRVNAHSRLIRTIDNTPNGSGGNSLARNIIEEPALPEAAGSRASFAITSLWVAKVLAIAAAINLIFPNNTSALPCELQGDTACYMAAPKKGTLCSPNCANIHGEPHIVTLDGYNYDFQAAGEYVAMKSTTDDFEMQVRYTPWGDSRVVSWARAVALNVAGDRVAVYFGKDPTLRINGQVVQLTGRRMWLPGGGRVEQRGREFTVTWPDGSVIQAIARSVSLNLVISLPESRRGKLIGLLGNFDGDPANDLTTRDGKAIVLNGLSRDDQYRELYKVYGDSWRISQQESLFGYVPGEDTKTFADLTFPDKPVSIADLDEATRKSAEQTCRNAGVTEQPYLDNCILDVGLTDNADFAQGAAQVIAAVATPTPAPASVGPNTGSDGGQIAFGETRIGALTAPTAAVSYTLTAKANDMVVANVVPQGNVAFEVALVDPRQQLKITCNEVGCQAPSDGTYSLEIRVRSTGSGEPAPYKYTLFVDRANSPANVQPIAFGQTLNSTLTTAAEIDSYMLTAKMNDEITANVSSQGNIAFDVFLFDPRQQLMYTCNEVGCPAKTDGTYYLQVRYRSGSGSDPLPYQYTIFLDRATNPVNVQPIAFDQTLTSTLTTAAEIDSYALTVQANQVVTANAVGVAGVSFDLFLFDSRQQLLCTFNEVGCLAQTDGTYYLQVRFRSASGKAALPYQYTLFVDRATDPVNVQRIGFGQTITGELTTAAEIDSYIMTARENDVIAAKVTGSGQASFDLILFDPRVQKRYICSGDSCRAWSDGTLYLQVRYHDASSNVPPPYRYSIAVQQR